MHTKVQIDISFSLEMKKIFSFKQNFIYLNFLNLEKIFSHCLRRSEGIVDFFKVNLRQTYSHIIFSLISQKVLELKNHVSN